MKIIAVITVSLILNIAILLRGRGSFLTVVLSLGTSLWIGFPLLILSGACFSIAAQKLRIRLKTISGYGIAAALIIFSTLLTIPIGNKLVDYDVRKAKAFFETLVPKMEVVKDQTGSYPTDLSEILAGQQSPHLFEPECYHCDGTNYSFTIADPGTIMGGWLYNNQNKQWDYWN